MILLMLLCVGFLGAKFTASMEQVVPIEMEVEEMELGFSTLASFDEQEMAQQREMAEKEGSSMINDAPAAMEPFEGGWLNDVGGSFDFKCEKGKAITQIRSTYTHRLLHKDRKWSFKCEPTYRLNGMDSTELYRMSSHQFKKNDDINFECKKGVLVGVSSKKPGKKYWRSFIFNCFYTRPKNIISCHHKLKYIREMAIPWKGESSISVGSAIAGIKATKSGWKVITNQLKGCVCQPGYKDEACSATCKQIPCSFNETKSAPGHSFAFSCPPNQIVHKIAMDVSADGNIGWAVECYYSPMLHTDVTCTYATISEIDNTKRFQCPNDGVITGIEYFHDNGLDLFNISCCSGKPRHANKCRSDRVQGPTFNPNGGSFSFALENKHEGITALEMISDKNKRRVWTPTFIDITCICDIKDEGYKWSFLKDERSGLVLDQRWNEGLKGFRTTLQVQNGNDGQLWTHLNDRIMSRRGKLLDHQLNGLVVLKEPSDAESQRWKYEDGRIFNEKSGWYISFFGPARDGMHFWTSQKPMSIDKRWVAEKFDEEYLCMAGCWRFPCQNGGQCVKSSATGYECNCPAGFQGRNCEENVNECLPSLCQNNAVCVDGVNDYACSCMAQFRGKDCDIPVKYKQKVEDIRCVDITLQLAEICMPMKEKVEICHTIQEGIDQGLELMLIFENLINLGHRLESPLNLLEMIAASAKLRERYENYPLKCIRNGNIKAFEELLRLMKEAKIKAIPESVQSAIEMAVKFFKSPIEGEKGISQLLKLQGMTCGEGSCTKEDILSIIATTVLPNASEYDGFHLDSFRGKQDLC